MCCGKKIWLRVQNGVKSGLEEKDLIVYILKCVNHYYGLSIDELKQLAYQLAKKLRLTYPSAWDANSKARKDWYLIFMKRHSELTLRTPEQTSMNRVKSFCKPNVDKFFDNLALLIEEFEFDRGSRAWHNGDDGANSVRKWKFNSDILFVSAQEHAVGIFG